MGVCMWGGGGQHSMLGQDRDHTVFCLVEEFGFFL